MPKFAVYFVPKADSPLYQRGTQILGYDVRSRTSPENPTRTISSFDSSWIEKARPYGFHLTIGDAIDFSCNIVTIECELASLLSCFSPKSEFMLKRKRKENEQQTPDDKDFVRYRGDTDKNKSGPVILRYYPNRELDMLHTLVVARINTLGTRSTYTEELRTREKMHELRRIWNFHSWTILDSWAPHFTVLDPYPYDLSDELRAALITLFGEFDDIVVDRICLLFQMGEEDLWTIYREFVKEPGTGWR